MFMSKKGFTLIELSIVLLILFLIAGGIIGGSKLISNAKINNLIKEIAMYQQQIVVFKKKYGYLPGQMPNAREYHSHLTNGAGLDHYYHPNEEDIREKVTENFKIFDHLHAFGLSDFKPSNSSPNQIKVGVNVPASSGFKEIGFSFYSLDYGERYDRNTQSAEFPEYYNNVMVIGRHKTNSYTVGKFLTGAQAFKIDSKIDDGIPSTGRIYAVKNKHSLAPKCTTSDVATDAKYDRTLGDEETCFIGYKKIGEW